MRWNGRNRLLVTGGMTLSLAMALADIGAQATSSQMQAAGAMPSKRAEEQFKNIQTLKGVPAEQIIPSMQFIAASLGVECEYCHVRGSMEKDDKKTKLTTRKMMTMMMAINKENFEGHREVTCFSCHHGAAKPVAIPIITDEAAKPAAEVKKPGERKPDLPAADQLLDMYLAAAGGADALQKITSRVQKGTLTAFGGQHFPVEIYSKTPGKRISIMHLQDGESVTGFDGKQGWLAVSNRVHMMSAAENDAAWMDADLHFAVHLKSLYGKFGVEAGEKIGRHQTYLVVANREGLPPLRLYFDRQSGLLLRLVRYAETPLGSNPTQIDYADYRDARGVKVPFRWTLARPGNRFTIQVDDLQQNVPVDDARFAAPLPPPAGAPKPARP